MLIAANMNQILPSQCKLIGNLLSNTKKYIIHMNDKSFILLMLHTLKYVITQALRFFFIQKDDASLSNNYSLPSGEVFPICSIADVILYLVCFVPGFIWSVSYSIFFTTFASFDKIIYSFILAYEVGVKVHSFSLIWAEHD